MTGSAGTAAKALGLVISGWLIGKFKFSARTLSAWNVILGVFYFSTLILFSIVKFLNCFYILVSMLIVHCDRLDVLHLKCMER